MMMKKLATILLLVAFIVPQSVTAETVIRTGESVSISNENGIVGDFYAFGNTVSMSGLVEGDFITAAGSLTSNGSVTGDVLAVGASVDVHGAVDDDVRVIGGEVVIADVVGGDVVVVGANIKILSTASIGGDLVLYGSSAEVSGAVAGTVLGSVSELRLDSAVTGDVQVNTDQLTLGDNAAISGTVTYESANLVQRSPNATVEGEIIRNDRVLLNPTEGDTINKLFLFALALIFAALSWFMLSRKTLALVTETAAAYSLALVAYGLATIVLVPFLTAILLTSMVGSLLGLVLLFSYLGLLLLSLVALPVIAGKITLKLFGQPKQKISTLTILFGALIVFLLALLPIIGLLVLLVLYILTLGTIVSLSYRQLK